MRIDLKSSHRKEKSFLLFEVINVSQTYCGKHFVIDTHKHVKLYKFVSYVLFIFLCMITHMGKMKEMRAGGNEQSK